METTEPTTSIDRRGNRAENAGKPKHHSKKKHSSPAKRPSEDPPTPPRKRREHIRFSASSPDSTHSVDSGYGEHPTPATYERGPPVYPGVYETSDSPAPDTPSTPTLPPGPFRVYRLAEPVHRRLELSELCGTYSSMTEANDALTEFARDEEAETQTEFGHPARFSVVQDRDGYGWACGLAGGDGGVLRPRWVEYYVGDGRLEMEGPPKNVYVLQKEEGEVVGVYETRAGARWARERVGGREGGRVRVRKVAYGV